MRRRRKLKTVVDTNLYGQDHDDNEEKEEESFSSLYTYSNSISPMISGVHDLISSTSSLHQHSFLSKTVEAWTRMTGCKTDVVIRVHDHFFHLHKEILIPRSRYLSRHLTEFSHVTISPPSTMEPSTFSLIASFCYSSDISITPLNLVAIRVAAEWLEMAATTDGGELLCRIERYFFNVVESNAYNAMLVLRCCRDFVCGTAVEAVAAFTLGAKCVEALAKSGGDDGWLHEVAAISVYGFRLLAESMRVQSSEDHGLLYRVVDFYFDEHEGKLTDTEKSNICYTIDCTKLPHHLLIHLVQNPRLPLRFVVQAMLAQQLHTRQSLLYRSRNRSDSRTDDRLTLGAILQRDTALNQSAGMRTSLQSTSMRIESLERELSNLRQQLPWSVAKKEVLDGARSASFRFCQREPDQLFEKSVAFCRENKWRGFGRKLSKGLKNMFGM